MRRRIWTDIIFALLMICNITLGLYVIDLRMQIAKRDAWLVNELDKAGRKLKPSLEEWEKRKADIKAAARVLEEWEKREADIKAQKKQKEENGGGARGKGGFEKKRGSGLVVKEDRCDG